MGVVQAFEAGGIAFCKGGFGALAVRAGARLATGALFGKGLTDPKMQSALWSGTRAVVGTYCSCEMLRFYYKQTSPRFRKRIEEAATVGVKVGFVGLTTALILNDYYQSLLSDSDDLL